MPVAYKPQSEFVSAEQLLQKNFTSFYESLSLERTEWITKNSAGVSNGGVSLYIVPQGYDLYIVSYSLTAYGTGISYMLLGSNYASTTRVMAKMYTYRPTGHEISDSQVYNLNIPLKLEENETIWVESSSINLTTSGVVVGFLVPKKKV